MNVYDFRIILEGYEIGDKNGGPTELAKILNKSLAINNGFNKIDLIKRYYHWWKTDAFDTGPTFAMVFKRYAEGSSIEKASKDVDLQLAGYTAGCGPVHRIAPLACYKKITTNRLIDIARQEAAITHYNPEAGNCSAIMVLLCRELLKGNSWEESKNIVSNIDELSSTWIKIQNGKLNNHGYVIDVMHSAFYFLDNKKTIEDSLSFGGPANYAPVIIGIIKRLIKEDKDF